jgi:hypothetical protein
MQSPEMAYWFDSFGEKPPEAIRQYLMTHSNNVQYNPFKIQNIFANTCAHFAISFIFLMSLGFKFKNVINIFHLNSDPDHFVRNFINSYF